ncbi:MAG: hypothetical protein FWF05_01275 [Oscillospiraceae bacterium]|nr:hypothetical protein [Oscillospiraceae bacterium]
MASKITYRSVAALLALTALPTAVFASLFRIVGDIVLLNSYVGENLSLWEIYDLFFRGFSFSESEGMKLTDSLRSILPALIAAGVFLVLTLLLSLVITGFAAFSNKKLVILCLSGAAVLTVIGMFISFGQFAKPLCDGTVSIADLGIADSAIINSILGAVASIKVLQLSTAGYLLLFEMIGVAAWTGAFLVTEIGN